jgi:hypothetical protein
MMYFLPALTKACTFDATCVGVKPAQPSLPHSPVANAHVSVVLLVGITDVTGCRVPVTAELITLVFQFMLIVMSLNGLNTNEGGGELGPVPPVPVPPEPEPDPLPPLHEPCEVQG